MTDMLNNELDIGGNIIINKFYKFNNDKICDLNKDDYQKIIIDKTKIKVRYPLGINGIHSTEQSYENSNKFSLETIINMINEYYSQEILDTERELLDKQSDLDISSYSCRIELLELSNLYYYQGIDNNNGVYTISLGS